MGMIGATVGSEWLISQEQSLRYAEEYLDDVRNLLESSTDADFINKRARATLALETLQKAADCLRRARTRMPR